MTQNQKATIILAIGIAAVSTAAIFIRFAQNEAPSLVIAAYRLGLATLCLTPFFLRRSIFEFRGVNLQARVSIFIAGFLLALHFAAWITSLEMTTVASSVVLVTTTPLWVALLSPFVLSERLKKGVWVGLGLAMGGGILVGLSQSCELTGNGFSCANLSFLSEGRGLLGNFLALAAAWASAGYMLAGRRLRPYLSLTTYIYLVYGIAALFLIVFVIFSGNSLIGYSIPTFGFFVLLALIPQLLGHTAFNWALRYVPATFVALALLGEPIGTTILAVIFLSEAPGIGEIAGGVMILAGIYLATKTNIN
jgi:drug/metabolite transporter (DMT)-like permease